mgnify:CR=1 FL=1
MTNDSTPKGENVVGLMVGPEDGYTLRATLVPADPKKARVTVTYRPALPEATMTYRVAVNKDDNPKTKLAALLHLLKSHVIGWDLLSKAPNGEWVPFPFKPEHFDKPNVQRALGMEYLDDMANLVNGYTMGEVWEEDAKNS